MEQLIGTKAVGVAEAKQRAQLLQQEAKDLLLKASEKLQRLKGGVLLNDVQDQTADRSSASLRKLNFSVFQI